MASGSGLPSSGYEVVVPGRFGPAYHAAFAAMGAPHSEVSSVFFLSPPQGVGIPDIAAMLQARGLVILDIRRVDSREPLIRGQPTPHTSHRGPARRRRGRSGQAVEGREPAGPDAYPGGSADKKE